MARTDDDFCDFLRKESRSDEFEARKLVAEYDDIPEECECNILEILSTDDDPRILGILNERELPEECACDILNNLIHSDFGMVRKVALLNEKVDECEAKGEIKYLSWYRGSGREMTEIPEDQSEYYHPVRSALETAREAWRTDPEAWEVLEQITPGMIRGDPTLAALFANHCNWLAKVYDEDLYGYKHALVSLAMHLNPEGSGIRNGIAYVDTPKGQVSFHMFGTASYPDIGPSEWRYHGEWTGVPTQEKSYELIHEYAREKFRPRTPRHGPW